MNRRAFGGVLVTFFIVIGMFFLVGFGTIKATSSPSFCRTCHEIKPNAVAWTTSPHKEVGCLACHAEPGAIGYYKRKLQGIRELSVHLTTKEPVPRARIDANTCLRCHSANSGVAGAKDISQSTETKRFNFSHKLHLQEDGLSSCLVCHSGTGHPGETTASKFVGRNLAASCAKCHDQIKTKDNPDHNLTKQPFTEECAKCHRTDPR